MDRLLLIVTHAGDDPERATIPFMMATTSLAAGLPVTVMLQLEGAWLGKSGYAAGVSEPGFPDLNELLTRYLRGGNRLLVCGPCAKERGLGENELVDGAVLAAAPTIIGAVKEASTVITY